MKSLERAGHVELGWTNGWAQGFGEFLFPAGPTVRLSAAYLSTLRKDAQPSAEDRTDAVDNGNGRSDLSQDDESARAQLMEAFE